MEDILKNNPAFAWTFTAVLAVGTIVGVAASAHGQKAAGGLTGGRQWLAAMDTDNDDTVSKEEFNKYMDTNSTRPTSITTALSTQRNWSN